MAIKKSAKPTAPQLSIEQILELAKQHGLQLVLPTTDDIKVKQEESKAKLGIKGAKKKAIEPEPIDEGEETFLLEFPHTINSQQYGPGYVTIPRERYGLINSLKENDHRAKMQQLETTTPRQSKAYMIFERQGGYGKANVPVRMNDDFFSNPEGMNDDRVLHSTLNNGNAAIFHSEFQSATQRQGKIF